MAYLIAHMAFSLLFTMLLGLLLGWLLWGYVARERSKEVQSLRNRIAEMQVVSARTTISSFAGAQTRMAIPETVDSSANSLLEGELPERVPARNAFFEDEEMAADPIPVFVPQAAMPQTSTPAVGTIVPPMPPDLEAEVKEARLQHLQQQVRDLEGLRDRMPILQADLSDALAGRRAAESRFQEAKSDFEVRSSSLLSQIRDFENAAVEWDRTHEQLELERIAAEKELSSVRATLRDLQNSQRPQTVESSSLTPTASAIELADLRERYQRALRERDAIAVELEFWKQSDGERPADSARLPELEEAVRSKDAQLAEQAARVESLLWHVAELEPFAAEAPQKEEDLRRQESEIAGHMAMHSENGERIRSLQNHIVELQASTVPSTELEKAVAEHAQQLNELQQSLAAKDDEIAEHVSARYADVNLVNSLQARIAELEAAAKRLSGLEKLLAERDTEIRGLLSAHSEMQHEMQTWKAHATELEPIVSIVPELQSALEGHAAELKRLKASHGEKESQVALLQARLDAALNHLAAQQQRLPEMEQKLVALEEQHQGEVSRLKVNSAQRIRRLRQSITNFR